MQKKGIKMFDLNTDFFCHHDQQASRPKWNYSISNMGVLHTFVQGWGRAHTENEEQKVKTYLNTGNSP